MYYTASRGSLQGVFAIFCAPFRFCQSLSLSLTPHTDPFPPAPLLPWKEGVGLVRTVIYLDVLLLVNFVVGAAFLLAAGLLCGACCSPLRLVGGAGAAAVSSLALLAPTAPWPLALTYKGTSAALCVAAAYGWQGARNTARLTAWFVLLNLTLTGALFLPGAACNNLSFYLPVSQKTLSGTTRPATDSSAPKQAGPLRPRTCSTPSTTPQTPAVDASSSPGDTGR